MNEAEITVNKVAFWLGLLTMLPLVSVALHDLQVSVHTDKEHRWIRRFCTICSEKTEEVLPHATIRMCPVKSFLVISRVSFPFFPHTPLHLTVQTLSTEPPMTHVEVSATGEVMRWKRNLNRHSCASASPPVPSCHGDGCGDCHCGNGGVHAAGGGWVDGWGVLEWRSTGLARPDNDVMASHIKVEVTGYEKKLLLPYLFWGKVVSSGALGYASPLRPLTPAARMVRGERQVAFGALQETSHQTPSHLMEK